MYFVSLKAKVTSSIQAHRATFLQEIRRLTTTLFIKTCGNAELKNSRVKFNITPLPIQNILSAQLSLIKY